MLVITLGIAVSNLSNSEWWEVYEPKEDSFVDCPDVLKFGKSTYVYYNDCYAIGTDGIIESGEYRQATDSIRFLNRRYVGGPSILSPGGDPVTVEILAIGKDTLGLRIGESMFYFRRRN